MGLAELFLGKDNPFSQYVADNRNTIHGAFAGLGQGTNFSAGLGNAAQGARYGAQADQVAQAQKAEEAKRTDQINQTAAFLRAKGAEDLAAAVEGGMMDGETAFGSWRQDQVAASEQAAALERARGNAQFISDPSLRAMVEGGAMPFEDAYRYQTEGGEMPSAPSGYQWVNGALQFIPGGPADPAAQAPKAATDAERRGAALTSVVDTDAALLLGDGATPGVFEQLADSGDQFWNAGTMGVNPLKGFASGDYQRAANAVENIAQSYLYAISGQAAPAAEVEKIINSITPRPLENPAVLAEKKRRLEEYVNAIRMSAGNHAPAGSGDGWEVIGVQ